MRKNEFIQDGIFLYLEKLGLLDSGNEKAIAAAKKDYIRQYKTAWLAERRKNCKEIRTFLELDEYKSIESAAIRHMLPISTYFRKAAMAYTFKKFLLPSNSALNKVIELLSLNYNAVQSLEESALSSSVSFTLSRQIEELEVKILSLLQNPVEL